MREVESVFREPGGERVFDPARALVANFNKALELVPPRAAQIINELAEEIVQVRLRQDNVTYRGRETDAMYHEMRRGDRSGIAHAEHGHDDIPPPSVESVRIG